MCIYPHDAIDEKSVSGCGEEGRFFFISKRRRKKRRMRENSLMDMRLQKKLFRLFFSLFLSKVSEEMI
jgi:hypothetical protein